MKADLMYLYDNIHTIVIREKVNPMGGHWKSGLRVEMR